MVAMSRSLQPLLLASLLWTGLCHPPVDPEFKAAFDRALIDQLRISMPPVQHSAQKLHHPPFPSTGMHHPRGFYGPERHHSPHHPPQHPPQHPPPSMMHHLPQHQPPFMMHQPPDGLAEEDLRHMHGLPGVSELVREDMQRMHGFGAEKRAEEDLYHKLQNMHGGPETPPDTEEALELEGPGMPPMPDEPPPVHEMMRALFPGPLHPGGQPIPDHAMPFAEPDPVVLDMLDNVDHVVHDVMTPVLHSMGSASQAPASCHADLQKHCPKARSQVHCLGLHSEDISEPCEKDVGKSVPFVCSHAIDEHCNVLQNGILDCLKGQLVKLPGPCKEAVLTTSKALSHLNGLKPQTLAGPEGALPPAVQQHLDRWKNLDGWRNTNQLLDKEEDQIKDLILQFQNKHGTHGLHHRFLWYLVVTAVLLLIYLHFRGSDFGYAASSVFAPRGEPLLKEASPISKEFDQLV